MKAFACIFILACPILGWAIYNFRKFNQLSPSLKRGNVPGYGLADSLITAVLYAVICYTFFKFSEQVFMGISFAFCLLMLWFSSVALFFKFFAKSDR